MDVFPAAFPLAGLRVAVAGSGEAADAKARLFDGSAAVLVRVAPEAAGRTQSYAGARLAFIALPGGAAALAAGTARAAGALVNVVDRPELCDFNTPAIIDRGPVVGAVATGGAAPLLAAELRREIEARWPQGLGGAARLLQALQGEARAAFPDVADRRAWLRRLLDGPAPQLAVRGEMEAALVLARGALAMTGRQGRIDLLVPPPAVDLLSLRALQALGRADRVVVVDGVEPALLALARRDAPVSRWAEMTAEDVAHEAERGAAIVCIGPATTYASLGPLAALPIAGSEA